MGNTPELQKYILIEHELNRAIALHPDFPTDMFRQLAIMQEEAGEVTKAVLKYHYEKGPIEDIIGELIQTAAMCVRMLQGFDNQHLSKVNRVFMLTTISSYSESEVLEFMALTGLNIDDVENVIKNFTRLAVPSLEIINRLAKAGYMAF